MKIDINSGAAIAAAAAALLIAGAALSAPMQMAAERKGPLHGGQRLQGHERLQDRGQ